MNHERKDITPKEIAAAVSAIIQFVLELKKTPVESFEECLAKIRALPEVEA